VGTILRPIKEFDKEFSNRTPDRIGSKWKHQVIVTVADRYAVAVEDLIATVQRTEVALKNRKARRMAAGGMSDGEKVKLQLYLDYQTFSDSIREVGVEPASVIGLSKLGELTAEGEKLLKGNKQNGA
jgi:phosphoenolpyruvate carboxylase